jgi:DNA-binding response OmpR family regulator
MPPVRLLMIVSRPESREWLEQAVSTAGDLEVTGIISDLEQYVTDNHYAPTADVIVVDIERIGDSPARFWTAISFVYLRTPVVAVFHPATDPDAIHAALHARLDAFVELFDTAHLLEMVRATSSSNWVIGYLPVAKVASALFQRLPANGNGAKNELHLDGSIHGVKIGKRGITLTPLEFEVLSYLLRHPGRAVSHLELLGEVWRCPLDKGGTLAQVRLCIRRIREKIEPDAENPHYLLTVRGVGYSLNPDGD